MSARASGTPTRKDHDAFCVIEQWRHLSSVKHHKTYTLTLNDGRVLRTRISRPVGRDTYAPSMFAHILDQQLECTKDQFFDCVDHKVLPPRPAAPHVEPDGALDLKLVFQLKSTLHLSDSDIMALSTAQAHQLLADYYSGL